VADYHKQPVGLVHGGVFATLAESICSVATYLVSDDDERVCALVRVTMAVRPARRAA
jgi:acyl-coenzyme A thioesterase PaaI-like protein